MSLGEKTHVLLGAVLPMLQLALQAALTSDNDADSERRLGVLQVIAGALAEDYGKAYVRTIFAERGCSESFINKILGTEMKKGM